MFITYICACIILAGSRSLYIGPRAASEDRWQRWPSPHLDPHRPGLPGQWPGHPAQTQRVVGQNGSTLRVGNKQHQKTALCSLMSPCVRALFFLYLLDGKAGRGGIFAPRSRCTVRSATVLLMLTRRCHHGASGCSGCCLVSRWTVRAWGQLSLSCWLAFEVVRRSLDVRLL